MNKYFNLILRNKLIFNQIKFIKEILLKLHSLKFYRKTYRYWTKYKLMNKNQAN